MLSEDRRRRLFSVFNTHLKSHFVPFTAPDPDAEQTRANELRRRQCEAAAAIIAARTRPNRRFVVVGDMNDAPDSPCLAPLVGAAKPKVSSGLTNAKETRPERGVGRRRV